MLSNFENKKFVNITQQCFALLPQGNFPAHDLNFHWRWRNQIQAIFLNLFYFKSKAPTADEAHANSLKVLYSTGKPKAPNAAKTRQISTKPERVLDAPDLRDDFYLHLLDWSKNNHMAVALHDTMFVWNAADGSIEELCTSSSHVLTNSLTANYFHEIFKNFSMRYNLFVTSKDEFSQSRI